MNYFHLTTTKDDAGQPVGPHHVHMQLTAEAKATGFGEFLQHFEVPVLQGRSEPWGDDGTEYWFELNDEDARIFSQALTICFYGLPPIN
ncbi:hypothetical protein HER32_11895 [Hymenobacter sp. BT18]|uniref:hypothetical protein n=1 Tax=Hymenobacter sp. BT18 TaxID=2835648 RepID=UPI00143E4FFC|nr:hypothetical protein [Hymenobacter sp. BT18]QIX61844.1 hypothetical protein HER32_11895 [Hymenobacter sp. BT18]